MGRIDDSKAAWLKKFITKQTQLTENTNEIYLAAGGYYQKEYIAIFEDLTSSLEGTDEQIMENESNVGYIAEMFINKLIDRYPDKKFPFNKILSVTLPSQIIAKTIQEKLEKETRLSYYQGISGEIEIYGEDVPTLIRLASYYSFTDEIQFKNIVPGDKVLIVNDVISTGGLINQIYESILELNDKNTQKATIACVLSVVDSRVLEKGSKSPLYRESKQFLYSDFSEDQIYSLETVPIDKYNTNPEPRKRLVRINPILNSRITIESKHSEDHKIVFKDAERFFELLPNDCLKIGHFAQNSLHHSYFVTPGELFKTKRQEGNYGIRLLRRIVEKIEKLEHRSDISYYVNSINNQLDLLHDCCSNAEIPDYPTFSEFKEELKKYLLKVGTIQAQAQTKSKKSHPKSLISEDDFVFFPVFSGIENLHKIDIQEIFGIHYSNIISLQRFDTNKGWRFIIPQKSYNKQLKGKTAVILDMGSFTGDSIIQMIDALCVFELKKIVVISMIGRLEDFDREFFSRVQEMKVKKLNDINSESDDINATTNNRFAPVKIYFGVNLQIPPALSTKICEHCNELILLDKQKNIAVFKNTPAKFYIDDRIEVLKANHINDPTVKIPSYFPLKWSDSEIDTTHFFTVRHHLGKIDGYRFYTDYYNFFDNLSNGTGDLKKNLEGIIAVCIHENHLFKTIRNQLPDVKQKITDYINDIVLGITDLNRLYYDWNVLSILQAYFLVNEPNLDPIFQEDVLIILLDFVIQNTPEGDIYFQFLAYKFAENYQLNKIIHKNSSDFFTQTVLIKSIKKIWQKIDTRKNLRYHSLITHFNRQIVHEEMVQGNEHTRPFFALFDLYDNASAYQPNHGDFTTAVNNLKTTLINVENGKADFNDLANELQEAEKYFSNISDNLNQVDQYLNGLIKLFKTNTFAQEYISGDKSFRNFMKRFRDLLIPTDDYTNNIEDLWKIIADIQATYFSLDDKDNLYNLWKTSNYMSVLEVWNCFLGKAPSDVMKTFHRFIKEKNYPLRIEREVKAFKVVTTKAYRDIGVSIHPYLLIYIFKELLDNSLRHAPDSVIKVTLTNELRDGINYSVIGYHQNKPSAGIPTNGLLDVQKILKDFNGDLIFNRNPRSLLINVVIPLTNYKRNHVEAADNLLS